MILGEFGLPKQRSEAESHYHFECSHCPLDDSTHAQRMAYSPDLPNGNQNLPLTPAEGTQVPKGKTLVEICIRVRVKFVVYIMHDSPWFF